MSKIDTENREVALFDMTINNTMAITQLGTIIRKLARNSDIKPDILAEIEKTYDAVLKIQEESLEQAQNFVDLAKAQSLK